MDENEAAIILVLAFLGILAGMVIIILLARPIELNIAGFVIQGPLIGFIALGVLAGFILGILVVGYLILQRIGLIK